MIYHETYELLLKASGQIISHRQPYARANIERSMCDYVGVELSNEALLGHIVAEALSRRVDRRLLRNRNIYVQELDVPQTELFYSMAEAVPFVGVSHSVANQFAVSATSGARSLTIVDIGVGRGQQLASLLKMLAEAPNAALRRVEIVGLDAVEENVRTAATVVEQLSAELPFSLSFHPVTAMVEELTDEDWDGIRRLRQEALIVNSAYTLHHTHHEPNDETARTQLLGRIASLAPDVFTLIEPNSNHDTEDLQKRLYNAWLHYGSVFALIDESGINGSHKHLIKKQFFGREIEDIFGVSDRFRSERHERYDSWLLRLHRAGFRPLPSRCVSAPLPSYCDAEIDEGLVRLGYRDLTIVAVIASTPMRRGNEEVRS